MLPCVVVVGGFRISRLVVIEHSVVVDVVLSNPGAGYSGSNRQGTKQHFHMTGVCFVVDPVLVYAGYPVEYPHLLGAIGALAKVTLNFYLEGFLEIVCVPL